MLLLPTELSETIDGLMRADLLSTATLYFNCLIWSTRVVVIGAILEGAELVLEITALPKRWWDRWKEPSDVKAIREMFRISAPEVHIPTWSKVLAFIGLIAIIGGVVGEWIFQVKLEAASDDIQTFDSIRLTAAQREAGSAAASATIAHQEAGAAATSAKIAHDEARAVREEAEAQGPRWRLINRAAPELVKELSPFAGQQIDLIVCGASGIPRSLQNEETMNTWASIARILEGSGPKNKGANWSVLHGGLTFLLPTLGCAGIEVFVSSEAPRKTTEAANRLGSGLTKALPPSSNKMPSVVDADFSRLTLQRGIETENEPWHLVTIHPDEIAVFIGPHP